MTLKEAILSRVDDIRTGMNSLRTSAFGSIFFWQEVSAMAEKKLKEAWAAASDLSDDAMRALGEGEHVVARAKRFVVVAKISAPRRALDLERLKALLLEAYPDIRADHFDAMVSEAKMPGKSALTKRVLEKNA